MLPYPRSVGSARQYPGARRRGLGTPDAAAPLDDAAHGAAVEAMEAEKVSQLEAAVARQAGEVALLRRDKRPA